MQNKNQQPFFEYDFSEALGIKQKPEYNLNSIANNQVSLNYDFSEALGIKPKRKKQEANLDGIYNAIVDLEKGNLTKATNNPGAVLYTEELAQKFKAVKGPKLPSRDNPEGRELYTAVFPDLQMGENATKFIIKNIYDSVGGDVESFASVYPLGLKPSQLIDDRQIAIKDRYMNTIAKHMSFGDLQATEERRKNDIASAVISETNRIKRNGEILPDGLESLSIFKDTNDTFDISKVDFNEFMEATEPSSLETSKNLNEQFLDMEFQEESKAVIKNPADAKKFEGLSQIEEKVLNSAREYTLYSAPQLEGVEEWKNTWMNIIGAPPDEDSLKGLAVNVMSNVGEVAFGLGDLANQLGNFIMTGKGGSKLAGDILQGFASTPEVLSELIVASGLNPIPTYNNSTAVGRARVKEAQKFIWQNPVMPILAAVGTKYTATKGIPRAIDRAGKVQVLVKEGAKEIQGAVGKAKTALEIKKGNLDKRNADLPTRKLADSITNPAVLESVLKVIDEGPKAYTLKTPYTDFQFKQARKNLNDLSETFFETKQRLDNPYVTPRLTEANKIRLENSLKNTTNLIKENARILGDNRAVTNLQGGFGLTKEQAKMALNYAKDITKNISSSISDKILARQINSTYFDVLPEKTKPEVTQAVKFLEDTDKANLARIAESRPSFYDTVVKIATQTYDVSAGLEMAVNRLIKKAKTPEEKALLNSIIIDKNAIRGSSAKSNALSTEAYNAIFAGLNRKEYNTLNQIISLKAENSLKKFNDSELIRLKKEKTTATKSELKKINKEIKRIENYRYTGDKRLIKEGLVDDVLDSLPPEVASKLNNKANIYFDTYKHVVDNMQKAGIFTEKEALKYKSRDYRPKEYLKFLDETLAFDEFGKKTQVSDKGIKKMKEGDVDFLFNANDKLLYDFINSSTRRIEANRVYTNIANIIKDNPNYKNEIGYVLKKAKNEREIEKGFIGFNYLEDGTVKTIALEKNFATNFLNQTEKANSRINKWQWVSGTKLVKAAAVGYSPAFAVKNMLRDIQYVYMNTNGVYSRNSIKFIYQISKDIKAVAPDAWYKKGAYIEGINQGLSHNILSTYSRFGSPFTTATKGAGQKLGAFAGKLSEFSEITTRLAVRRRAMRNGHSPKEATYIAKNYIDFGASGSLLKGAEIFFPFAGARVQATRGMLRSLRKNPKDFAIKSSQILGIFLASKWWQNSSDENKDIMSRVSDYDRLNNFVFPFPVKVTDQAGRQKNVYGKIPLDDSHKLILGLGEMMYSSLYNEPVSESVLEQTGQILSQLKPVEISNLFPTINIMYAIVGNRKFPYNVPIYKGDSRVKGKFATNLDEELVYKDLGNFFDASPAKIKYSFEQFGLRNNFFYDVGLGSYNVIRNALSDEDLEIYEKSLEKYMDIPVVGAPGIRTFPTAFLGLAADYDYKQAKKLRDVEEDKLQWQAENDVEISSLALAINQTDNQTNKIEIGNQVTEFLDNIKEEFGEEESDRLLKRFEKNMTLGSADLARTVFNLAFEQAPFIRASVLVGEIIKYPEDRDRAMKLINEVYRLSPTGKRAKKLGYLNDETIDYYNAIMKSMASDTSKTEAIYKNPIYINK